MHALESHDELASLREALQCWGDGDALASLLAEASSPSSSSSSSSPVPSSSPPSMAFSAGATRKHTALAPPGRHTHGPRKAQLSSLRVEVLQLRQQLMALRRSREPERGGHMSEKHALCHAWAKIAKRQRRQRRAAEIVNATLHEAVAVQLKTAHMMERLLHKANTSQRRTVDGVEAMITSDLFGATYAGPSVSLEAHLDQLAIIGSQMDAVLCSGHYGAVGKPESFRAISFRDLGIDGLQYECAMSAVLPFGLEAVLAAFWRDTAGETESAMTEKMILSNFVAESTTLEKHTNEALVSHGQTATRLFRNTGSSSTSDTSVGLISRLLVRTFDSKGNCARLTSGSSWIQLTPATHNATPTTPAATRVKWCSRITVRPPRIPKATPAERAQWVNSVISGPMRAVWLRQMDAGLQAIESRLIDAVVSR